MENKLYYYGQKSLFQEKIDTLKSCNIDVSKYVALLSSIEDSIEECILDNDYENISNLYFIHSRKLEEAISEMDSLYSDHLKVMNNIKETALEVNKSLKNEIEKIIDNLTYDNIDTLISKTIELLDLFKKCDSELDDINNIYKLIYTVIKIELIMNNESKVLDQIRLDKTDSIFISKLVKEDINSINSKNGNSELVNMVIEIENNSFSNDKFLDKKLITLLIYEIDTDLLDKVKDSFSSKLEDFGDISFKLKNNAKYQVHINDMIKDYKKDNRIIVLKDIGKCSYFLAGISFFIFSLGTIKDKSTESAYVPAYKTYISSYDTSDPDSYKMIEEYMKEQDDDLTINEYSSWDEPGYYRDGYTRTVYTYYLKEDSDVYFKDVKDYLSSDLKKEFRHTEKVEKAKELPKDETTYTGNKYVASRTYQDKTDSIIIFDKDKYITNLILRIAGVIASELSIYLGLNTIFLSTAKQGSISKNKKIIQNKLEEINNYLLEAKNLNTTLDDIKKEIERRYEFLPEEIKSDEEIKNKMLVYIEDKKESE